MKKHYICWIVIICCAVLFHPFALAGSEREETEQYLNALTPEYEWQKADPKLIGVSPDGNNKLYYDQDIHKLYANDVELHRDKTRGVEDQ